MMAIQLLGELKSSSALPVLASMLCEEEDFFVIREIALALCRIGTRESWELIDGLRHHPSRLVRDYAHLLITESFPGRRARSEQPRGGLKPSSDAGGPPDDPVRGKDHGHR